MARPLLITDCDEVLLHMVVPFQGWLDEVKHVHFDLEKGDFVDALRHKHDGTVVPPETVWPMLQEFFIHEMHRQQAIDGAVAALQDLSQNADVVVLTNLLDDRRDARAAQLRDVGIDFPVVCNQGGKGEPLAKIIGEYQPSVAVFVDDLGHHHSSVKKHVPSVWRLHMVGEPLLARHIKPAGDAHARIDCWREAHRWIADIFARGVGAQDELSLDDRAAA